MVLKMFFHSPVATSLFSQGIYLLICLKSLGFILNQRKYILTTSQSLEFYQIFLIHRQNHDDTFTATRETAKDQESIFSLYLQMMRTYPRQFAHLIGLMTSSPPAVLSALVHYRILAIDDVFPSSVDISPVV